MSLSSSLFTGTSGLKNMGNALQVTGNNLSNLNTIGYKRGRATFADTLYETVTTQGGADQMGRGMSVGDVSQNFSQGSFESTGNATDLSIGGNGFFIMRQTGSENKFYTRAGNFFFDKGGRLVNPEGYMVQGWALDEETGNDVGAIGDIILEAFTNAPKKSSEITAITNLDADALSQSVVLSNNWNSGEDKYLAASSYEYQTVTKVYDSLGSTHDVTIYYDKKSGTEWEYIVTCNPDEDKREGVQGTESKGLLARGTITFSQSSGDILDITMSEFTGRLGNFSANGINTVDDISYEILNAEQLAYDGYGFSFEYDGSAWNFVDGNNNGIIDNAEKPANYPNSTIVYSDEDEIHLVLNQQDATDTDPDIIFKMKKSAVATDSIGFDINEAKDLHVQGIEGTRYFGVGDTANDNTTLEINDPSVMTTNSKGLGIVWNPNVGNTGKWYWSNPALAYGAGGTANTLVSGVTLETAAGVTLPISSGTGTFTYNNVTDMSMVADIKMRYNGTNNQWDWNDEIKTDDFNNIFNFVPTNEPTLSIKKVGSEGAIATITTGALPTFYWLEGSSEWSLSSTSTVTQATIGGSTIKINTAATSNGAVNFDIWYNDPADATTAEYTFGTPLTTAYTGSMTFIMDPTPPSEYADAKITYSPTQAFDIDFVGDNTLDLKVNPTAMAAPTAGAILEFSVNPNVPPKEYANATLRGDHTEAIIDLDGSGNDNDKDDIRFSFADALKFGASTHPYNDRSEIDFDIVGSTAWTEISKTDIEEKGYFGFKTDFLGGDYGLTENDIKFNIGAKYEDGAFVNDSLSSTQFSRSSSTIYQDADGYSAGDLESVDVSSDGVMTGRYSNGELIPLFRVGLASFRNNYGLSNEGGNLFSETRASGNAITNKPGENGLGIIAPNSLEMSNVDISEEFVNMITNQRGFQANSKTVTTVDEMMNTVISMKR